MAYVDSLFYYRKVLKDSQKLASIPWVVIHKPLIPTMESTPIMKKITADLNPNNVDWES